MAKPTNTTSQADIHPALHNFHVDVKMFGAKGDGTTDDSVAIIAAKDAVIAAGGGVVYFPPVSSFYKVTNQETNHAIRIAANGVTFQGAGYGSRIHNASVDSSIFYVGDIDPGDTAVYTGITFKGLRLTQTLPHTADDFACITIRSAYGARVEDCDFDSCSEAISIQRRNVNDAEPEACQVINNRINGSTDMKIGIELYRNKGAICKGNQITSASTTGLGIRLGGGQDNEIEGNFVRGANIGISVQGVESSTYPSNRPHIHGNRVVGVLGTSRTAIQLVNGVNDAIIEDNYLDDFINGIWCKADTTAGGTDRTVIKGNYLRTASTTTRAIYADPPSGSFNNTDVHVKGNHIEGLLGGNGIVLDTVDGRNYILENTITIGSGGDAISCPGIPSGTETTALRNTIVGVSVLLANDLAATGTGKFVHWDHSGNTSNTLVQTDGNDVLESIFTPAQITANQNDYDPLFGSGRQSSIWRVSSDAARNITGIAGGWQGRRLLLINIGGFAITLKNQDVGSAAANRIIGGAGADVVLAADGAAGSRQNLIYDDTTARWRVL